MYIYIHVHLLKHTYTHTYVCSYIQMPVHTYAYTYIHLYIHMVVLYIGGPKTNKFLRRLIEEDEEVVNYIQCSLPITFADQVLAHTHT